MQGWAWFALVFVWLGGSSLLTAQARALITGSPQLIPLPNTIGSEVVLGSVLLGKPRTFNVFDIQASGTITPDPAQHETAYQIQFLICDQPDCSGEIHTATRILSQADSTAPAQVIATGSFGVKSHSVAPVSLTGFQPHTSSGNLYLAVALRLVHSGDSRLQFSSKLNLLRVDVMP